MSGAHSHSRHGHSSVHADHELRAGSHLGSHQAGDSDYDHQSQRGAGQPLAVAVVLTALFALVELAGGLWSGSLALLADAGHMATDAAALLFALAANFVARRPVSDRHSFGLARAEVIAAFVNALAMLAVVAWIFFEAIDRIRNPIAVNGGGVFVIAALGLAVNLMVAWWLARDQESVNTRAALIHVIGDLLGSVAAVVAGTVIFFGGPLLADPLLSMAVGALILRSTFGVLRETTLVLLDSVPAGVDYGAVGSALAQIEGVTSVHDLHIWSMVPGRGAASAHVLVEDIERWPAVLRQARATLRERFGLDHVTLQPEWLRSEIRDCAQPVARSDGEPIAQSERSS